MSSLLFINLSLLAGSIVWKVCGRAVKVGEEAGKEADNNILHIPDIIRALCGFHGEWSAMLICRLFDE